MRSLTASHQLLLLVKQSYEVQYSGKLEAALTNNLQGDFQRLVATLLQVRITYAKQGSHTLGKVTYARYESHTLGKGHIR